MSTIDTAAYGLALPQPYRFSWPEELPRNAWSQALSASIVAMVGQGRLVGFTVSSTKVSGQFIQLFDAPAVPAAGAVPIVSIDIATVSAKGVNWGPDGRWMREGIVVCNSTTQGSLTAGAADCLFDVQYVPQVI